jgi:dihydrofolate reductase
MTHPEFHLAVVCTEDGFIARHPADSPASWASAEEQDIFFQHVNAASWAIMGRNTHEAADRPERRRIIFSRKRYGWQRPTQLWLDPESVMPRDLPHLVHGKHPFGLGLILGGTTVHDWFDEHNAIDRVFLTIEPVRFGEGLPVFTGASGNPLRTFAERGYVVRSETTLNAEGTRYLELRQT